MNLLGRVRAGEPTGRRQVLAAAAVVTLLGIGLIIAGVAAGWDWSRLPGAVLIVVGGMAGGAAIGLSQPAREQFWSRLMNWRIWIALVAAVIIATPAILAMASATIGPLAGGGDANDTALVVIGALVGFVFMIGTLLAAYIAVHATYRRVNAAPRESGDAASEEIRS